MNIIYKKLKLYGLIIASMLMMACTSTPQKAQRLAQDGLHQEAVELLAKELKDDPSDRELRVAYQNQKDLAIQQWVALAERALSSGQSEKGFVLYERASQLDANHPRVTNLRSYLDRLETHEKLIADAKLALLEERITDADAALNKILAQAPGHSAARSLKLKLREMRPNVELITLGSAYKKPINLEFRDAPLRNVMDALARTTGVNFVFDPEVRNDTKITIQLKDSTIEDALKVILSSQQLERKILSENSILIYPRTPLKQKEYQDYVMRTFYMVNADVKQVQNLVRTIAKTKDLFADERLNMLVVRDTPGTIKLIERLIDSIDLAEPEVMLEVEVMEISSNRSNQIGLQWPKSISYGLPNTNSQIEISSSTDLTAFIPNPAFVAQLRETVSSADTLASPRLRVRNREKAKILIGDKLPVFSTTTSGATGAVSSSASYLEVGLKLDFEPTVLLDNDVTLKINLEVSSVTGTVTSPEGATGYQVGTRQASSSLRLHDGETQVLAGLIRDEESKGIAGIPGLARLPLLGRLFGAHSDGKNKTELVLFVTPRVIRNISLPDSAISTGLGGLEGDPGAEPLRINSKASVKIPLSSSSPMSSFQSGRAPFGNRFSSPSARPPVVPALENGSNTRASEPVRPGGSSISGTSSTNSPEVPASNLATQPTTPDAGEVRTNPYKPVTIQ